MKRLVMAYLSCFVLLTSCGGEADICDPTGNWTMVASWGAGDCGGTDPFNFTFTITQGPNGFLISGSDPSVTVTGTIVDENGACRLSATEFDSDVFGDGTTTASISYNLTADVDGSITGNGTLSASGAVNCSQAFTTTGNLL